MDLKKLESECGRYRYLVSAKLDGRKKPVCFVLDNPPDVDPEQDPDVRKCLYFAKREGFGGALIVYANGLKKPYIPQAQSSAEVVGDKAEAVIKKATSQVSVVILAWGDRLDSLRSSQVVGTICLVNNEVYRKCLGLTQYERPAPICDTQPDAELWPYPAKFYFHPESDSTIVMSYPQANAGGNKINGEPLVELTYKEYLEHANG